MERLSANSEAADSALGPLQALTAPLEILPLSLLERSLGQHLAAALGVRAVKNGQALDQRVADVEGDGDDELGIDGLGDVVNGALPYQHGL